ncbi:MAG: hypothetical protein OEW75_10815 [Cyclobacteriaceae bacterium]|nr:hypothetical protein [Cyclobacteriaceae bacterium]
MKYLKGSQIGLIIYNRGIITQGNKDFLLSTETIEVELTII